MDYKIINALQNFKFNFLWTFINVHDPFIHFSNDFLIVRVDWDLNFCIYV